MVLGVGFYRGGVPKEDLTPIAKARQNRGLCATYTVLAALVGIAFLAGGIHCHSAGYIYTGLAAGVVSTGFAYGTHKADQQIKALLQLEE